jgi:hypothetical protein
MRRLSWAELTVVCVSVGISAAILLQNPRRTSFKDISIPPVHYQNVELQVVLADVLCTIQKQRGTRSDYRGNFQWEKPTLRKRHVWLEIEKQRSLWEIMQRLELLANVRFDYLQHPYHPGDVGHFIIRDARQKQLLRPKAAQPLISIHPHSWTLSI